MRYLAVALDLLALVGCGDASATVGSSIPTPVLATAVPTVPRLYTAADVVAAFRAHGLAAVDPRPYVPSGVESWYDGRPQGDYTIERVVNLSFAGVVWIAHDGATADAITAYVAGLRDMGMGYRQYRHYRMRNAVLFFYFLGGDFDEAVLARYWVAFGTMP